MAAGGRRLAIGPHPAGDAETEKAAVDLSIVIPCHDDGEFVGEAVESAERSVPPRSELRAELVIVDDGSRDAATLAALADLRRAGYRVIAQENAGLAAARNRGIAETSGRYLLPLDADNRLLPGFPAAAAAVLDGAPEVGVVYGDRVEFGARSGRVQVPELDLDSLLRANSIDACAVLRREVWEQCGGYDAAMPAMGWEDWDLWLGAAERGWGFHRLPEPAFEYRVRPGSMASRLHDAGVGVPLRLYLFDKHRELYRSRLPQLLTAQHLTARVEADRDRVAAERDAIEAGRLAAIADRDRLLAEVQRLVAEGERLRGDLSRAEASRAALAAELADSRRHLADSRRHIAFIEGTAAWRLRATLLRLRGKT